ncbi:hemerythrin domain-containing protein [Pontiella sp.]|uniref:hemerythrin domain-containing protein n=1 Tax=Pontiella sp. TaxID=2837462 RepID=UPI003563DBF7
MSENVTQVMMDEHQLILRMITLVEQNSARVRNNDFSDWAFFIDAVDFIRNYADRYHHAKEEDVLFVELVKNGMPEKSSPIEAMLMEHDQGRALVKGMESAALTLQAGEPGGEKELVENAEAYAALLRGHIQKEDTILYPLSERVLPGGVRGRMLRAYEEADRRMADAEPRYRTMVERYEAV